MFREASLHANVPLTEPITAGFASADDTLEHRMLSSRSLPGMQGCF